MYVFVRVRVRVCCCALLCRKWNSSLRIVAAPCQYHSALAKLQTYLCTCMYMCMCKQRRVLVYYSELGILEKLKFLFYQYTHTYMTTSKIFIYLFAVSLLSIESPVEAGSGGMATFTVERYTNSYTHVSMKYVCVHTTGLSKNNFHRKF